MAETVFADAEEAARYMLPVASIDAAAVHAHLSGPLHFVVPIDPYDGVVGEFTSAFHSATCRDNWLGFKVVDGRYQLDTDYRFFEQRYYEDGYPVPETVHESVRGAWSNSVNDHYTKIAAAYAEAVASSPDNGKAEDDDLDLSLGGLPPDLNWSNMNNFALEYAESSDGTERHPYPLTQDGRRYDYIGSIESTAWRTGQFLRCLTLLFFDQPTQRALLTFDWT